MTYLKVGDKVKHITNRRVPIIDDGWFEIIEIDLPYWTDELQYKIEKLHENGYKLDYSRWAESDELITEIDFVAKNYNL